ncbi:hypothetical protein CAOG_009362 [Capsaspora owczarzaki ATCC 30864]|uniref:Uncharacterized protein n=1 Tax=Capsaspora owczarzaki (strain ATCC 30864) TaxID=595528 RepID=A0A0D2U2M2_CAPO3|nr:hypothetical protein CAOG_009362 [Capsaspora owczarzaki ATCC 30864]
MSMTELTSCCYLLSSYSSMSFVNANPLPLRLPLRLPLPSFRQPCLPFSTSFQSPSVAKPRSTLMHYCFMLMLWLWLWLGCSSLLRSCSLLALLRCVSPAMCRHHCRPSLPRRRCFPLPLPLLRLPCHQHHHHRW